MTNLIHQLQTSALDSATKVAQLTRLARVVALKLEVPDFEKWVTSELDGYSSPKDVPPYRIIRGTVRSFNRYQGWREVQFGDSNTAEVLSIRKVTESVGALESLLDEPSSSGHFSISYPPDFINKVKLGPGWEAMELQFGAPSFAAILDAVRNAILDWSLRLEKAGVLGKGMTFSGEERSRAAEPSGAATYNATHMTVVQSMQQSQIQQGSPGATQSYDKSGLDTESILAIVKDIRELVSSSALSEADREQVEADLATVEAQTRAPKPSPGIVMSALGSVKRILEGAAASMTAAHAPAVLDKLASILS